MEAGGWGLLGRGVAASTWNTCDCDKSPATTCRRKTNIIQPSMVDLKRWPAADIVHNQMSAQMREQRDSLCSPAGTGPQEARLSGVVASVPPSVACADNPRSHFATGTEVSDSVA